MCDPHVEGKPWPYAPRVILKNQLAALADRGMSLHAGAEPEYFLVKKDEHGRLQVADELDDAGLPCYDAKGLTRSYTFLTTLSKTMNALGWANYANDHEDGNGQFEQNFRYADAVTTADRMIIFRYMVHALAQQQGMLATFMPKPFKDRTGTGMHLHVSLWDAAGTTPLFPDASDPRKLGLSATRLLTSWRACSRTRRGLTAVTCPTVNSYKRVAAGAPPSGAAWAPAFVTYGGNNRTQMIRVPDGNRIELRLVDGLGQPLPGAHRAARRRPGRRRPRPRPGRAEHGEPVRPLPQRGQRTRHGPAASDASARDRRARRRRGAPRGVRQGAGRDVRGLLRGRQAR